MTLENEFLVLVTNHLALLADNFDAELKSLLDRTPPENATVAFFEYDSPHFADDFSVIMHLLSGRYEAVCSDKFLAGETVVPSNAYEDEKYESIEPWGLAGDIFEDWLVDRWHQHEYSLDAYVGHHDSIYCTRLTDGKKIRWDDVTF